MKFLSSHSGCRALTSWALVLAVLALAGCGRGGVETYRLAKETPQTPAAVMPTGHPAIPTAAPKLQWKLPADWEEVAAGEMRAASFRVKGSEGKQADVGVFPLPGLAGSDLDNVNRWRGQVGQPPVAERELAALAQPVEVAGQAAQLYEQAGENPASGEKGRILAVILRREGVTWFFKMTGDDGLVAKQKPVLVEFLKSLSFSAGESPAQLPPSHPPIDSASLAAQAGAATPSSTAKPNWQVPAGWQETPGGQFLIAKFVISAADNTQAAVNVSMSAGDGGGVAANVNRWRAQLGLTPSAEAELQKEIQPLDLADGKASLVEMAGTDARTGQKARLLAAIVPQGGQTWFYKLMGNEQIVEREKAAFTKFVQTAKY